MSKQRTNVMLFEDSQGYLCAVRSDTNSFSDAQNLAKEKLSCENVVQSHEYNHMYYGYGTSDGETESTWWLVDNKTKNGIPVYVFREC